MSSETHAVDDLKQLTKELLKSKTLRSFCLVGDWGVGKTFAWKEMVEGLRRNPPSLRMGKIFVDVLLRKTSLSSAWENALKKGLIEKYPTIGILKNFVVDLKGETSRLDGWKRLFIRLKEKPTKPKHYAYVSLFGLSTIEQVSAAIIQKTEKFSLQEYRGDQKIVNWLPNFFELIGQAAFAVIQFLWNLPFVLRRRSPQYFWELAKQDSVLNAFKAVGNEFVPWIPEKALICFDDLERRDGSLSINQLLGLVSHLQENEQCKIVFIFNENELVENSGDTDQFHRNYEKVFDATLRFQPDLAERIDIAVSEKGQLGEQIAECAMRLEIKNIRVLRGIERLCFEASKLLEGQGASVLSRAVEIIVFLEWARRMGNQGQADFIRRKICDDLTSAEWLEQRDAPETSAPGGDWKELVNRYGFQGYYSFDKEIVWGVESGYFREEKLRELSPEVANLEEDERKRSAFRQGWALYNSSFSTNQSAVVERLAKAFVENVSVLSNDDLNSLVGLFFDLEEEKKAHELIQSFREEHIGNQERWPTSILNSDTDKPLHSSIAEAAKADQKLSDPPIFFDVLKKVLEFKQCPEDEVNFLSESCESHYLVFLKNIEGDSTIRLCRALLETHVDPNGSLAVVKDKVGAALKTLAGESLINKVRIKNIYNIAPSPPNPAP